MQPSLALCALLTTLAPASAVESAVFRFAPRAGRPFTETVTYELLEERPTNRMRMSLFVTNQWTIKSKRDSYVFVCKTESLIDGANARPWAHPIAEIYEGLEQSHFVSRKGEFLRTELNKNLAFEIRKRLPPELQRAAEQQLSKDRLLLNQRIRYMELVEPFIGRSIKEGDSWTREVTDNRYSDEEPVLRYTLYRFPVIARHSEKETTVKVLYFMTTDKKLLNQFDLVNAPDIYSPAAATFLDAARRDQPVDNLCVKQLLNAETMTVISEDRLRRQTLRTPKGLLIVTERTRHRYDPVGR